MGAWWRGDSGVWLLTSKSFLVLFFKKELLSCFFGMEGGGFREGSGEPMGLDAGGGS
jgi:hypothetical protein